MDGKPYVKTLRVPYDEVLRDAESVVKTVTQFLGASLDIEAMTRQVDATLYRNREINCGTSSSDQRTIPTCD
jgi:isocitrate dehydrogenase kinase/phosphatase